MEKNIYHTGFEQIDDMGGFRSGELVIISGDSSIGKTTLAINMLINGSKGNTPAMLFTLESDEDKIRARINNMTMQTLRQDLEYRILSNIMNFPNLYTEHREHLNVDLFCGQTCKVTFNAIKNIYDAGKKPDLLNVAMYLMQNPVDNAPDANNLAMINSYAVTSVNFEEDLHKLFIMANDICNDSIHIDDSSSSIETIKDKIRSMAVKKGVKVFYIDFLQRVRKPKDMMESWASFNGSICNDLKDLAKDLGVCIVLIVQLNRNANNNDTRPTLSQMNDSVYQVADTVIFIYRPGYYGKRHKYRPELDPNMTAELIIAKGRNIGTGSTYCSYEPIIGFSDLKEIATEVKA